MIGGLPNQALAQRFCRAPLSGRYAWLVFAASCTAYALLSLAHHQPFHPGAALRYLDLRVYRGAAHLVLDGGPLYDRRIVLWAHFTYPPLAAVAFTPLAVLPLIADEILVTVIGIAALLVAGAAMIRTWATAYLQSDVVQDPRFRTEILVADGPYRHVRNPLYFANVLMIIAMGAMMSRLGFFVAVIAMLVFCYRLILREEAELQASQGQRYDAYCKAVPRLWPSLRPRIMSASRQAKWSEGFKAESWYWGFAAALVTFAITLKLALFFAILAASLVLFLILPFVLQKKSNTQA